MEDAAINYFELYPGDYLRDTTRLSLVDHGAYLRLLMAYYSEEEPLPGDFEELYTIAGAVKTADKIAVKKVAEKFFPLRSDGLRHNARADVEIAKAGARMESKGKTKSSEAERQQRYRDRRHDMFAALARVGIVPNFNISMDDLTDLVTQNVTQQTVTNVTPYGPLHTATRPQTPYTNQEQESSRTPTDPVATSTPAGRACQMLKAAGCPRVNPSHPTLLAAIAEGVTGEALADTYRENPDASNPFVYAITTARNRHAEGPKPVSTGPPRQHAPNGATGISKTLSAIQRLQGMKTNARTDDHADIDSGRLALGCVDGWIEQAADLEPRPAAGQRPD